MKFRLTLFIGKRQVFLALLVIFCCLLIFSPLVTEAGTVPMAPKNPVNLEVGIGSYNKVEGGIIRYIEQIYLFATAIVGALAVIMIIIGAVQYSASAGNKAALGSAKETITSAIIGLVIVLMAYLILGAFSGSFTNLTNPRLDIVTVPDATCPADFRQAEAAECGGTANSNANANIGCSWQAGKVCCCQRRDSIPGSCYDFSTDKKFCDAANGKRKCFRPVSGPYSSKQGCTVNCVNKNPAHFCQDAPVTGGQQSSANCCYEDVTPPPPGVPECPTDTTTGRMYTYQDLCQQVGNCYDPGNCCKAGELSRCVPNSNSEQNWCCKK